MEPFKKQGGLKDSLGAYPSEPLSEGLSWEALGPGIQSRLRGRRRRTLLWVVSLGCLLTGVALLFPHQGYRVELVHAFPLVESVEDRVPGPPERPSSGAKLNKAVLHGQNAEVKGRVTVSPPSRGTKSDFWTSGLPITVEPSEEVGQIGTTKEPIAQTAIVGAADRKIEPVGLILSKEYRIPGHGSFGWELLESRIRLPSYDEHPMDSIDRFTPRSRKWRKEMSGGLTKLFSPRGAGSTASPLGHRLSLTVGRTIGSTDWSVWSGIELAQYWQKEELREERDIHLYQPNTIDTVYRNNFTGEERIVYTDTVPGRRIINVSLYQQLRSFSIPVMVRKSWTGKWTAALRAGIDVNYNRWRAGEVIGPEGIPVETTPEDQLALAARLGGRLYFPTTRYGRLFVGIGYRAFLGDIRGPSPATSFRPRSGNISVGLQW